MLSEQFIVVLQFIIVRFVAAETNSPLALNQSIDITLHECAKAQYMCVTD